jgi:hypothetical protein
MWGGTPTRPKREIVETTEKMSRVDKLKNYKKKRNKYYYELIKSIMDGAVNQCNSVVIYYDEDIHKMLLDDDIAAYADSSNNIVVTIDPQRVSQFKKK